MRLRTTCALALLAVLALATSCGGGTSATPTPTAASGGIPTATPFATVPPALIVTASAGGAPSVSYTVQPGDNLLAIAARFGSTVSAIQSANHLTGSDIYVGQKLTIPGATAPGGGASSSTPPPPPSTASGGSTATATPAATGGATHTYIVQLGDTATGIATQFNVTLDALAAANGMTVSDLNNLHQGQKLEIPSS